MHLPKDFLSCFSPYRNKSNRLYLGTFFSLPASAEGACAPCCIRPPLLFVILADLVIGQDHPEALASVQSQTPSLALLHPHVCVGTWAEKETD